MNENLIPKWQKELRAYLGIALLMYAYVVYIVVYILAVLLALHYAAYIGLALSARSQTCGIGQYSLQKLPGHYLHTVVVYRLDRSHADIFKAFQMCEI